MAVPTNASQPFSLASSATYVQPAAVSAQTPLAAIPNVITLSANAAATTLLASQSGSIVLVPTQAQAQTVTLPALAAGLNFHCLVQGSGAVATGFIVSFQGPANTMAGSLNTSAGAAAPNNILVSIAGNRRNANFTATAIGGDFLDLFCDGTNWFARGQSAATAGLSFT